MDSNSFSNANNNGKRPLNGGPAPQGSVGRQPAMPGRRPVRPQPGMSTQGSVRPQPGASAQRSVGPQIDEYQLEGDRLSQSLENINQTPVSDDSTYAAGPKNKKSLMTSVTCGVLGLILGGVGVFAIMQILQQPPVCPDCDCPQSGDVKPAASVGSLDYDFLKLEQSSGNIIYSPLSIKNGLALLNAGAGGETKAEITKVLGDATIPQYENVPDKLSFANAAFIRNTFEEKVSPEYVSTVTGDYGAEILYDDFASIANMDNWVNQKTFGLINTIGIQPTPDTEMVLANALAIQLDWSYKFDGSDTQDKAFHLGTGEETMVSTMNQLTRADDVFYHQDDNVTTVSMPLESVSGADLEFVAVMPTNDLGAYIENLDANSLDTLLGDVTPASDSADGVVINIPKFKFDYALDFKNDLNSLGISAAFTKGVADFSGITTTDSLYVSDAVHKANIDFSEEGIKAAAVTTSAMKSESIVEVGDAQPVIINIDHPFLFLIRDKANDTVWFTGAVYQPSTESESQVES